ncbi:MAG: ABC transporter substrate-binding protein, partial [Chloroflexi bacterium]|nr:ABC transporter substrate-binding protein [Chloroflexota bacterium]
TGHWNVFVTNAIDVGIYDDLINVPFAKYYWSSGKWMPLLATSWKIVPPNEFVLTMHSGLKWSDGKDVTPQDVIATFNIGRLQSWAVWHYLDKVSASGNDITFHMAKPASVVQRYVLEQRVYSAATFGSWADKADALFTAGKTIKDPEVKALLTDFEKFRPAGIVANGPFMFDEKQLTEAQLALVKNPTGYAADKVLFDKIIAYNGETPVVTPLFLAKQIDYGTYGFPTATVNAMVQEGFRILTPPIYSGPALYINYARLKGLTKPEVRQAIAYAIDRVTNATVSLGKSAIAQKYMTGLSDNLVPLWLEPSDIAKLNQYPLDQKKAESMLQSAGWKKGSDGIWVDDTGKKWDYDLEVPADYADWSACAQNLAEQLTKFGLKTTVRAIPHVQAGQDMLKGNFNLSIQGWGAGSPYPQFSYESDILANVPPENPLGPGNSFPLTQTTKIEGQVNFKDLVVAAGEGLDQAKQKVAVSKLALAFNELLPTIPIWERYGNNPALDGVRVTGWPADGDPIYRNSPYSDSFVVMMLYTGQLKPVQK